jgi:hypothetical protein
MSEAFIHTCYIDGYWPERDQYFAMSALVFETLAVYYWCESFVDNRRSQRRVFCVVGQRGLSEYVTKISSKVLSHIVTTADKANEGWGYKFGLVVSLREALRKRRDTEITRPEYQDQCNASTYRARKQLNHNYKVGVKDQPVEYDLEGFRSGKAQQWTLAEFKTPLEVLNDYARHRDCIA